MRRVAGSRRGRGPSSSRARLAWAELVDRLARTHDHQARRWPPHLPREGEPFSTARPLLLVLGLPTFALSFAISVITTYGPELLIRLTHSPSQVGLLIGAEGAFALAVPLLSGRLSDRRSGSAAGRRVPFILAGAPLTVLGLALFGASGSLVLASVALLLFFVGYYLYYPPYRALYADFLPRRFYARAQASQAILRGAGLGSALLAGGLLLALWPPLSFVLAAVAVVVATAALSRLVRAETVEQRGPLPYEVVSLGRLLRSHGLRTFAVANACWEFSFAGLKSFIVLYIVHGLGRSPALASAVIAVVAVAYVAGAPLAGRLADRHGIVPVMSGAALVYGIGLLAGTFPHTLTPMLAGLPFVALAGAVLMTLPQALAFTLAPPGGDGAAAGLLDFSRGVGVVLGPVAVGAAVELFSAEFQATHGYAAMWPVIGIPMLASVLLLRRLRQSPPASGQPVSLGEDVGLGRR